MRRAYPRCFLSLSSVDVFGGQTFVFTALLYHLSKKRAFSNFVNKKAHVIVRGSVANIRYIVDEKGQEII